MRRGFSKGGECTGWIIFSSIVLLLVLVLAAPVIIDIEYGKAVKLRVRCLFITLYRIPQKPKKRAGRKKRQKAPAAQEIPQQETPAAQEIPQQQETPAAQETVPPAQSVKTKKAKKQKNPKAPTLSELFEIIKVLVNSLCKPLKKLLRRIEIRNLEIRVLCGGEDAAKAALKFGAVNLAVGNALGFLGSFFTLKQPQVDINVDFQAEDTKAEFSCTVKMCMMIFVIFLFTFLGRLVVRALRSEKTMDWLGRFTAKGGAKSPKNKA